MPLLDKISPPLTEEQRLAWTESPREDLQRLLSEHMNGSFQDATVYLSDLTGLPFVRTFSLEDDVSEKIPIRLISQYHCLPVKQNDELKVKLSLDATAQKQPLVLVTSWPPDTEISQWVYACCGQYPHWVLAPTDAISQTIAQEFGVGSGSLDASELESMEEEASTDEPEDQNAAVIRFVNEIIQKAVSDRATDIHFEPQRNDLQIRYRIDGQLVPINLPENLIRVQSSIISRLKIMARLNISERRRPQDGRIDFKVGNVELDIRISTLPTMFGESISLRLLNQKTQAFTVEQLGLLSDDYKIIHATLQRPHGIILVTGPTGSGKSTSLTAFLRIINKPELRLMTVEDPIEYEVPGVNQTQVHPDIGVTFASALRHILRQDPDVIMIGEIRDRETADIAIRASLTGHLVLSTLHTNDAPGALTRLIDMQIEPFLIASSVELILAQRLVRRLCPYCARQAHLEPGYLNSCLRTLGIDPSFEKDAHLVKEAVGCERCRNLGYRGRIALFEVLPVNDNLHELIVTRASARVIREHAIKHHMRTLQGCGWEHVRQGHTTLPEVMKFAHLEDG